jgi:hypothetical protein
MEKNTLTLEIAQKGKGKFAKFSAIDGDAAEFLGKLDKDLDLSGLTDLSDALAACLENHKGNLDLSGLKTLSDTAAKSLSKNQGAINLAGLTGFEDAGSASISVAALETLISNVPEIQLSDDFKNSYLHFCIKTQPQSFAPPARSLSLYDEFSKLRAHISRIISLAVMAPQERFLARIQADKEDLTQHLLGIQQDGELSSFHALPGLVAKYFADPCPADWSIRIHPSCLKGLISYKEDLEGADDNMDEGYGGIEPEDAESIAEFFFKAGASFAQTSLNHEDVLYEWDGADWLSVVFRDKMLQLKIFHVDVPTGDLTLGVYLNEVGILAAGPSIGDKWLNYKVIAMEFCDFLNRCLYPDILTILVGDGLSGVFIFIEKENVTDFVDNLAKALRNSSETS